MFSYGIDGQTDERSNTLAARGLGELFSSCAVVSSCGVVLFFLLWQDIVLGVITYDIPVVVFCLFFGCRGK